MASWAQRKGPVHHPSGLSIYLKSLFKIETKWNYAILRRQDDWKNAVLDSVAERCQK